MEPQVPTSKWTRSDVSELANGKTIEKVCQKSCNDREKYLWEEPCVQRLFMGRSFFSGELQLLFCKFYFFCFLQQIPKMNVLWLRILYRAPSPRDPLFKLYLKTLGQLRKPLNSVANNQTFYDLLYSCCSWVTNSQRRAATEKMLLLHPKEFQSFVYPSKRIYFVRDSRENNL